MIGVLLTTALPPSNLKGLRNLSYAMSVNMRELLRSGTESYKCATSSP